jgi:hypothetical protein
MTDSTSHDWSERVTAWVERTCAEQGVPVKLSDPLALAEIAEIHDMDAQLALGRHSAREAGTRTHRVVYKFDKSQLLACGGELM